MQLQTIQMDSRILCHKLPQTAKLQIACKTNKTTAKTPNVSKLHKPMPTGTKSQNSTKSSILRQSVSQSSTPRVQQSESPAVHPEGGGTPSNNLLDAMDVIQRANLLICVADACMRVCIYIYIYICIKTNVNEREGLPKNDDANDYEYP